MARLDFDFFVIGAGSGGVRAARIAARHGARVGLAEESKVGGTCVIRGCVPKKLLVFGSLFRDAFEDANGFGWSSQVPSFDWPALIAAKDKEINRLNGVYIKLLQDSGVTLVEGRAVLEDAHHIRVGGQTFSAEKILIATGSWPWRPEIPGIEHVISSNEALDLGQLPRRVAVVGGGYIAVEFAGIFRSLGCEVAQILRGDGLLTGFDGDLRTRLAREMEKRGVVLHARTQVSRIAKNGDVLTLSTDKGEDINADCVMYATGRLPNTRGLGLEEAGVKLRESGAVVVDEFSRTTVPNIYAVGDCTDRMNLTPVATAEGHALADTLFNNNSRHISYDNVPTAVFSQPPLATVGLTEEEARAKGLPVDIYKTEFKAMKHALTGRDEKTFMKLVVSRENNLVLGCHMMGADAPEIIQGFAVALKAGATKAQFDSTIGIHPTSAEEFVTLREKVLP